jgi:hypothetical protein
VFAGSSPARATGNKKKNPSRSDNWSSSLSVKQAPAGTGGSIPSRLTGLEIVAFDELRWV